LGTGAAQVVLPWTAYLGQRRERPVAIDEARLEDCDIACYLDAHFDVLGTLTLEATRLHFSGEIILAADDRWPIEIDIALEPGRRGGRSFRPRAPKSCAGDT
jgi:hypothetical protein